MKHRGHYLLNYWINGTDVLKHITQVTYRRCWVGMQALCVVYCCMHSAAVWQLLFSSAGLHYGSVALLHTTADVCCCNCS